MPPKTRTGAGVKKVRRKEKKNIAHGHAHIKSTFNNTIVSICDPQGNVISWASAGHVGFIGQCRVRIGDDGLIFRMCPNDIGDQGLERRQRRVVQVFAPRLRIGPA